MKNEQESIFAPYLNAFVSQRVEQLTSEAEKLPAYKQSRESIKDQLSKAASAMGAEDLETLISAIRGTDIAIFEHIYRSGLRDGIWISGRLDQMKE